MRRKLSVRPYKSSTKSQYRDKWVVAEVITEKDDFGTKEFYTNGWVTPGGKIVDLFSLDLLYDSKQQAEEVLALHLLLESGI